MPHDDPCDNYDGAFDQENEECPEDKASRIESEAYAAAHAKEFCDAHADDMIQLIGTYGDGDAANLLENLRELFWARLWKPEETEDGK